VWINEPPKEPITTLPVPLVAWKSSQEVADFLIVTEVAQSYLKAIKQISTSTEDMVLMIPL
jgi:hypothetical protein